MRVVVARVKLDCQLVTVLDSASEENRPAVPHHESRPKPLLICMATGLLQLAGTAQSGARYMG